MSASVSTLGDSGWLIHVQNVLAGSAWIAAHVALESSSVLVHCRSEVLIALSFILDKTATRMPSCFVSQFPNDHYPVFVHLVLRECCICFPCCKYGRCLDSFTPSYHSRVTYYILRVWIHIVPPHQVKGPIIRQTLTPTACIEEQ